MVSSVFKVILTRAPSGRYTCVSTPNTSHACFWVLKADMSKPRFQRLFVNGCISESMARRSNTENWIFRMSVSGALAGSGILRRRGRVRPCRQISDTICLLPILNCPKKPSEPTIWAAKVCGICSCVDAVATVAAFGVGRPMEEVDRGQLGKYISPVQQWLKIISDKQNVPSLNAFQGFVY